MPDDRKISQLISRSLIREVSAEESAEIERHMDQDAESRKFANLSRLIQKSVSGSESSNELDLADEQLSKPSRQRLKRTVKEAIQKKLSQSLAGSEPPTGIPPQTDATDLRPAALSKGRIPKYEFIGRFQLKELTRQTDLQNSWRGRDEQLNRDVSIVDLTPAGLNSPAAWAMMKRDAEIMAFLQHPNVPMILFSGDDRKSGEPFVAMQWLGSQTLTNGIAQHHDVEFVEDDQSSLIRVLEWFHQLCETIAFAHSRGIIHTDLTPNDAIIDPSGQLRLIHWAKAEVEDWSEFSTGRISESNSAEWRLPSSLIQQSASAINFMAPEQALDQTPAASQSTDIYRLGAILFLILYDRPPHAHVVERSPDLISARKQIAEHPTPRTDKVEPGTSDLVEICFRAMSHPQDQRHSSAQSLADEMKACIERRRNADQDA